MTRTSIRYLTSIARYSIHERTADTWRRSRQTDAIVESVQFFFFNRSLRKKLTREKKKKEERMITQKRGNAVEYIFFFFLVLSFADRGTFPSTERWNWTAGNETAFRAFVTGTRGIINDVHTPRNDPRGQIAADSAFTRLRSLLGSCTDSKSRF